MVRQGEDYRGEGKRGEISSDDSKCVCGEGGPSLRAQKGECTWNGSLDGSTSMRAALAFVPFFLVSEWGSLYLDTTTKMVPEALSAETIHSGIHAQEYTIFLPAVNSARSPEAWNVQVAKRSGCCIVGAVWGRSSLGSRALVRTNFS